MPLYEYKRGSWIWWRKEIKKQTSYLQIIKKFAECFKVGCVTSGVGVWSLSVLKLRVLHHFSLHDKHFKLHPYIAVLIPDVSVYIINISACITSISMSDLTISRLPKLGRTGRSAERVKSSTCIPGVLYYEGYPESNLCFGVARRGCGASAAIFVSERPLTQYASSCGSMRFVLLLLCSPWIFEICAAI